MRRGFRMGARLCGNGWDRELKNWKERTIEEGQSCGGARGNCTQGQAKIGRNRGVADEHS